MKDYQQKITGRIVYWCDSCNRPEIQILERNG